MTAYYNENDPKAAEWLRQLIKEGFIAPGDVDERSIEDVVPNELNKYKQCHFFAGIGGWSYALRLAGWSDEHPVWTGSCPCQPFSAAGKGAAFDDERHLWPEWRWLVDQCRPAAIFGEQVASKSGRLWLSNVRADLETLGYGVGCADLCAAGAGAPHIRQRLFWMADSDGAERKRRKLRLHAQSGIPYGIKAECERSEVNRLADPNQPRSQGRIKQGNSTDKRTAWADCVELQCTDGKTRITQPGIFPLAHGLPGRVGLLRGYGNAIVPQVAAAFIEASDHA